MQVTWKYLAHAINIDLILLRLSMVCIASMQFYSSFPYNWFIAVFVYFLFKLFLEREDEKFVLTAVKSYNYLQVL